MRSHVILLFSLTTRQGGGGAMTAVLFTSLAPFSIFNFQFSIKSVFVVIFSGHGRQIESAGNDYFCIFV
jgi:hypothetical protein